MRRQLRCFQTRTFSTRQNGDRVMLRYSKASLVLRGTDERFFAALRMTGWLGLHSQVRGRPQGPQVNQSSRPDVPSPQSRGAAAVVPLAGAAPVAVPKLVP